MEKSELEVKLAELVTKSEIQDLRYSYWYAILDKEVDRLVSLFTEDIVLEYGFGIVLEGRQAAHDFFTQLLGDAGLVYQVPRGANGLIDLTSDTTGKGRWMVEAITLRHGEDTGSLASVQYFEEYRKVDGEWKLSRMKNEYFYFETVSVSDQP